MFGGFMDGIFGGATADQQPVPTNGYSNGYAAAPPPADAGGGWFSGFTQGTAPQEPGGVAPRTQSRGEKLTPAEVVLLAKAVREKGNKKLKDSWDKLKSEFDVQQRIWDSLTTAAEANVPGAGTMTAAAKAAAGPESMREAMKVNLNRAFMAADQDMINGVFVLKPVLQEDEMKVLNTSTASAGHAVLKAQRVLKMCERLATALEHASSEPAPDAAKKKELLALFRACAIEEAQMERRIRRVLGLGLSKADADKVKEKKAEASVKAVQQTIQQVAKAANVSVDKASKAIDAADGDPNRALVMLLSEQEELELKKAEQLAQNQLKKQAMAVKMAEVRYRETRSLAETISTLGARTVSMAWDQIRSEFEVQMSIWDNLAVAKGTGPPQYQDFQMEMEGVLANATHDPRSSVMLLEVVLHNFVTSRRGLALSNGMMVAADGILDAQRLSDCRSDLANKLRQLTAWMEAGQTLDYSASLERELKDLVNSSGLDQVMASRVLSIAKPKSSLKSEIVKM
eukprot:TRINITY_DN30632_c0_g1_i1.p1 TRINITY_DN30632_c0_g1~~TRINITY_DN30632_c0_g1_i1.p1  ORF type:complete len:513 (+),score=153.12 TRINITY_DN30632_c0_g1_i1:73-1611(+)